MVDSPHHPEQEVIFALGEAGVIDLESDTKKKATKSTKTSKLETKDTENEISTSDSDTVIDKKTEDNSDT